MTPSGDGMTLSALETMLPLRMTCTVPVSPAAKPSTSAKSRDGKAVIALPLIGGSLTGTAGAGFGAVVTGSVAC